MTPRDLNLGFRNPAKFCLCAQRSIEYRILERIITSLQWTSFFFFFFWSKKLTFSSSEILNEPIFFIINSHVMWPTFNLDHRPCPMCFPTCSSISINTALPFWLSTSETLQVICVPYSNIYQSQVLQILFL